jgi:hypothetical protein
VSETAREKTARIEREIAHIPDIYRKDVMRAIVHNESQNLEQMRRDLQALKDALALYGQSKDLIEPSYKKLEVEVALIPIIRALLPALKVGEVWAMSGRGTFKVEGLTFNYKGFHLAVHRSPISKSKYLVTELMSGASLGSPKRGNINEILFEALTCAELFPLEKLKSVIDSHIEAYGATPYGARFGRALRIR